MFEIFIFTKFLMIQGLGLFIAVAVSAFFLFTILNRIHSLRSALLLFVIYFGVFIFLYIPQGTTWSLNIPYGLKTYGPAEGPVLPFKNVIKFFSHLDEFERVENIARDPNDIPPPLARRSPRIVKIEMEAKEVISEIAPGVIINYWTFDGTVPGPFLRVREGDTVELTLKNDPSSLHHHNIDLHAVTGPGGGGTMTNVAPGESKTVIFKALNPGLYVYHCAHPNAPNHMAHGMYGLILVEPEEGLPVVDKELYVMQGEFYTTGALGKRGLQIFDAKAMLDGRPQYIVFNGKVKSLVDNMKANVGETVRVFVGNGGVNLISSFHVIGEIFDTVYPEGAIGSSPHKNVQTTLIPTGGASIVEFKLDVPGNYTFVDHALARMERGLWGILQVEGEEVPEIFRGGEEDPEHDHDSH